MKCVTFITARKRSLRRLCFYTCLSFILFTGGEYLTRYTPPEQTPPGTRSTPQSRHPPWDQVSPPSRHPLGPGTPPEQTPPWEQVHPPGADTPRTRYTPLGPGVHPREQTPPDQSMLGYTVNVRAVRILLECNLVFKVVQFI